ncbi:hypothetical protein P9869_02870 [Streptomyces ossamyceticus]|nr:hypothetical protein [Streptomyces ossamyceticus]
MLFWDVVEKSLSRRGVAELLADIHRRKPMRPVRHGQSADAGSRGRVHEVAGVDGVALRPGVGLVLAGFDHLNHLRSERRAEEIEYAS